MPAGREGGMPSPRRRRGMTIVELMTVIIILMILVATMIPSLARIQTVARTSQTRTIINTLATACSLYQTEFNRYPDSTPPPAAIDGMTLKGRHLLAQSLRGFLGNPTTNTGHENDADGQKGDGWRLAKRGTLYDANFFGVTDLPFDGNPYGPTSAQNPRRPDVFKDAFGNDIYYYAWHEDKNNSANSKFDPNDNDNGPPNSGGKYNFATYVTDAPRTFILISMGSDKLWNNDKDAKKKDDVTNFR